MDKQHNFLLNGVLRLPRITDLSTSIDFNNDFLSNPKINLLFESISVASPSLKREINRFLDGEKLSLKKEERLKESLYKYSSRISMRATPFGLFSSVGSISIDPVDELHHDYKEQIDNTTHVKFRIDTCSYQLIVHELLKRPEVKKTLKYKKNNTIYSIGNEFRYFEPIYKKGIDVSFLLSSLTPDKYLSLCLEHFNEYKYLDGFIPVFSNLGFEEDVIYSYIDELIDSKVLISEIEINPNETEPIEKLIKILNDALAHSTIDNSELTLEIDWLLNLHAKIQDLDDNISIQKYNELLNYINSIGEIRDADKIHIDSFRNPLQNFSIRESLLVELEESKRLLSKLTKRINPLKSFSENFMKRYNHQRVPVLTALDPELGIGYNQKNESGEKLDLIENLPLGSKLDLKIELSPTEAILLQLISSSKTQDQNIINLSNDNFKNIIPEFKASDSSSALFSLLDNESIHLREFSGLSGMNLISRFAHLDSNIDELCTEIANLDSNENTILAEIVHIPETKSGNLMLVKPYLRYSISCVSNGNNEFNIELTDLFLQISPEGELKLYSERLKSYVFPRLSNAVNYSLNPINVFKFLADFQSLNHFGALYFDWHSIESLFSSFPRVQYKNVTLLPAYWIITISELNEIKNTSSWRSNRKIPSRVFLSTSIHDDSKLFLDLELDLSLRVLTKELKKNGRMIISEDLYEGKKAPFVDNDGGLFRNEIVLPNIKVNQPKIQVPLDLDQKEEQSIFIPGSEWLYLKIYTGHLIAEKIFKDRLFDKIKILMDNGLIKKWFFVRYADPEFHIRLRFHLSSINHFQEVLHIITSSLSDLIQSKEVNNLIIDGYKREYDRYGGSYINQCEELFHTNSFKVIQYLNLNKPINERWKFAVLVIDVLLNNFDLTLSEKHSIMTHLSDAFLKEFNAIKSTRLSLNTKYRALRNELTNLLTNNAIDSDINAILTEKNEVETIALKQIENSQHLKPNEKINICCSLIHMFLNRLHTSNHRKQEMVLYYFLKKSYKSQIAQSIRA